MRSAAINVRNGSILEVTPPRAEDLRQHYQNIAAATDVRVDIASVVARSGEQVLLKLFVKTGMGRRISTGGIVAAGLARIKFTIQLEGVRHRPTLPIVPSEANLRRARQQLARIKQSIALGIISFADEFPDYRHLNKVRFGRLSQTCSAVFDAFLAHCEARVSRDDMAVVTLASYRKIIDGFWRPRIGSN
jgi:hypothetical protein